ncbi:MAG: DNA repair protein RadC [Candidatus Aenigmarchaeota archaeon]|nr:DNA repair protein RadC [Candidatus Aenigmarchaeota archaeon]
MLQFKELPATEKPRERMIRFGAEILSDSELLSLIIRSGYKNVNVSQVSRTILQRYNLKQLFNMPFIQLKKLKGIGVSKACEINAITEITRRIRNVKTENVVVNSAQEAVGQCDELKTKEKEHLVGLYLNTRNKLLGKIVLSIGNLDSSIVDPKEVYKHALRLNAYGVILLHNHPSGDPTPSDEDIHITKIIEKAGAILNVKLIDHIVVGENSLVSLKEKGLF